MGYNYVRNRAEMIEAFTRNWRGCYQWMLWLLIWYLFLKKVYFYILWKVIVLELICGEVHVLFAGLIKKIVLRWFSFSLLSSVSLVAAEPICICSLNALTLCLLDGPLIKYPQFPDIFNVWKVYNRPTSWYVVFFAFSCSMLVMSRSVHLS